MTVDSAVLEQLLPGPVTVVFERTPELNVHLNPGTSLVGIRVPDHSFIREVSRRCGQPLALTSANLSGATSALTIQVCICTATVGLEFLNKKSNCATIYFTVCAGI